MSETSRRPARALTAGALAAAPALALGWVLHRGAPRIPFAPEALADRIVRLTPGDVATTSIDTLHHAAEPILASAIVVLYVLAAAAISWRASGLRVAAALWAATLFAGALATPVEASPPRALLAAVLGGLVYAGGLYVARGRRARPADPGRRQALAVIAASTGAILIATHPLGRLAAWLAGSPSGATPGRLPRARIPPRPAFPAISGLTREITSAADHYVVDIDISDPVVDASSWRLTVDGLVERPLELGFMDLQAQFGLVEEISVLTCISNEVGGPLVGDSRWAGVRLAELLDRAAPRPTASHLFVRCADGYTAGIPLDAARHPSALVAIAQDRQALTREHGFPCRLRLPALYGMLNPKWVESIELTDRPELGYWAERGWSETAIVRTESRIDTPRGATLGEPTWIAGVAWAGTRGIAKVEVSLDEGQTWLAARIRRPASRWAWTQWAYRWTPGVRGDQPVICRATDGSGRQQSAAERPPHPSGASGYHRVVVDVS